MKVSCCILNPKVRSGLVFWALLCEGRFSFRFLFGEFRCQKAALASHLLQTRIKFAKNFSRALRARKCHGVTPENINRKQNLKNFFWSVG
jgi:hypothetical protein